VSGECRRKTEDPAPNYGSGLFRAGQAEGRRQRAEDRKSGDQGIRVQVISTAGYQVKEEGWQCLKLLALWANVMVCGYPGRFFLSELA